MKITLRRSASLDLFLALHREVLGRLSWELGILPQPLEPEIARFRDGLRLWREAGRSIPPPELTETADVAELLGRPDRGRADVGPADSGTRLMVEALTRARDPLEAAIAERHAGREEIEADLERRLRLDELAGPLAAAMGVPLDDRELALYVVPFAPYPPGVGFLLQDDEIVGAYLDGRRYVGATLADAALTQLAWAMLRGPGAAVADNLLVRLRALAPGEGPYARRFRLLLTKVIVELTTGRLLQRLDPGHRPGVDVLGTAWRFPRLYDLVRRHWDRYLTGSLGRAAALAAITTEAAGRGPRWYVDNVDGACLAADFYLMEWLAAQGDQDAPARLAHWVPQLAGDLAGQLDLIIGTELGHYECARTALLPAGLADFTRRVNVGDSRAAWWRTRRELGELPALDLAVEAFGGPGVEYGGEAWRPIAAMLRRYAAGELTPRIFVDQCFTLQHNNGCLFDKNFEAGGLPAVLDAQAATDLDTLAGHASPEVRRRYAQFRRSAREGLSPDWLGDSVPLDESAPPEVRTAGSGRLTIGAAPPGVVGCGSSEPAGAFLVGDPDQEVRTRSWQFRRPWPAVPRRYRSATATLHTSLGPVELELWPQDVPHTVDNFVALARGDRSYRDPATGGEGTGPFYDGTVFHRRVPGFLVETGDRTGTGTGGPGYRIPDEFRPDVTFDRPFLVAMGNLGRDSAGSRFFVTLAPARHLDGAFVQFGQVPDPVSQERLRAIAVHPGPVLLERVSVRAEVE